MSLSLIGDFNPLSTNISTSPSYSLKEQTKPFQLQPNSISNKYFDASLFYQKNFDEWYKKNMNEIDTHFAITSDANTLHSWKSSIEKICSTAINTFKSLFSNDPRVYETNNEKNIDIDASDHFKEVTLRDGSKVPKNFLFSTMLALKGIAGTDPNLLFDLVEICKDSNYHCEMNPERSPERTSKEILMDCGLLDDFGCRYDVVKDIVLNSVDNNGIPFTQHLLRDPRKPDFSNNGESKVKLRDNSIIPEEKIPEIMDRLSVVKDNITALFDLIEKCKNPNHKINNQETKALLTEFDLMDEDEQIYDAIKSTLLNSIDENGNPFFNEMILVEPRKYPSNYNGEGTELRDGSIVACKSLDAFLIYKKLIEISQNQNNVLALYYLLEKCKDPNFDIISAPRGQEILNILIQNELLNFRDGLVPDVVKSIVLNSVETYGKSFSYHLFLRDPKKPDFSNNGEHKVKLKDGSMVPEEKIKEIIKRLKKVDRENHYALEYLKNKCEDPNYEGTHKIMAYDMEALLIKYDLIDENQKIPDAVRDVVLNSLHIEYQKNTFPYEMKVEFIDPQC